MRHLKINLLLFSALSLGTASCLKKGNINIDDSIAGNTLEFANTGNIASGALSKYPGFYKDLGSLAEGEHADFNINVSYSGAGNAPQDITVDLSVDNSALATYNDQNGTSLVIPPASVISFPASVVIQKGTRITQVKATVTRSTDFDFNVNYGLPLKMATAADVTISQNYGKAVYSFGVRNQYDGDYTLRIKTTGWAAYGIADGETGDWPSNIGMVTSGGNTLIISDYYRGGDALQPAFTAGLAGATAFGAATPQFTFDVTTNELIDVDNTSADDGRGRDFHLNPAVTDNRYDPATKTIYAAYIMVQTGRPDQFIYDTLTYVGPRP